MKVVHLNKSVTAEGEWQEAAPDLEKIIREHPTNAAAYDRLMILYRKLKYPKKELKTINTAIKAFEETFSKKQPVYNRKVTALSKAILKATGLADKKGNNIYLPGELTRWKRRKELLIKRFKN